uniref:Ig-like domain-containing protein n=1 Tax=Gadus morhua TaxID=8049 RepID=A0A8C4YUM6_GADMO
MCQFICSLGIIFVCFTHEVQSVIIKQSSAKIVRKGAKGIQIDCSHDDSSYPLMYWYQRKDESPSLTLIGFGYESSTQNYEDRFEERLNITRESVLQGTLVLTDAAESDSAVYFCAASTHVTNSEPAFFGKGTKLTVLEPGCIVSPPTVVVLPPSEKECRDRKEQLKKTLVCVASGFYPDHVSVSWTVNGQSVIKGVASDHPALRVDDKYQITSRLRVEARKWYTGGNIFTCNVSFFNGNDTIYTSAEVYGGVDGTVQHPEPLGVTETQTWFMGSTVQGAPLNMIDRNIVYGVFVTILAWKLGLGRSHATAKK